MAAAGLRTSGDLASDRRYHYAMALLADGDAAAAADLLEQTLELVPNWPAGWFSLGEAREKAGDDAAAAKAYGRALDLDPEDSLGARLRLGRLGAAAVPAAAPAAFVRDLFDDYAPRFDTALVEGLGYRAPRLIAAAIEAAAGGRRYERALDLGCGTGLMAGEIRSKVGHLTGVDLSSGMIAAARSKNLYDDLIVGDVTEAANASPAAWLDLITAADVFCYLGDLAPVVGAAARALAYEGLLAFTVEGAQAHTTSDFSLQPSLRYCHSESYVIALGEGFGLELRSISREDLRTDRGVSVEGFVVLFAKPC